MQCGMEVVLADGELMRTGMGAMPGNRSWHVYKRGLGPTPDQLFMQSNFGIVTKMGVWLMPYPEVYMPFWVRVWRTTTSAPLVDTLRRLMLDGTIRMVPQIMNTLLLWLGVQHTATQWWHGEGPIPEAAIDRMARELEIGRWLDARRAPRRRGGRRPPLREDQGGVRADRRRGRVGVQVRARGHPGARGSRRARSRAASRAST